MITNSSTCLQPASLFLRYIAKLPLQCEVIPLAPPGCRVLVHDSPENRESFAPHGLDEWYVGPAMNHYQCYRVWMWETRDVRVGLTVSWFPRNVKMPELTASDLILASLQQILQCLKDPTPAHPAAPLHQSHSEVLVRLAELL